MKCRVQLLGLLFILVAPLAWGNEVAVDTKLSAILKEFEQKIRLVAVENQDIENKNRAAKAAFQKMGEALKNLKAPDRAVTLADTKKIRLAVKTLRELGKSQHVYLPDFAPELEKLGKLNLNDFPQTNNELKQILKDAKAMKDKNVARSATMLKRDTPPTPLRKVDDSSLKKGEALARNVLKEQKECLNCAEITSNISSAKDKLKALEKKQQEQEKANVKILADNKELTAELRKKVADLRAKALKSLKEVLSPVYYDGSEQYTGETISTGGRKFKIKEFDDILYEKMADSLLQLGNPLKYSDRVFLGEVKNYRAALPSIASETLKARNTTINTGLFSELGDYIYDFYAPHPRILEGAKGDYLRTELKMHNVFKVVNGITLDKIHDDYVALLKLDKYKKIAAAFDGTEVKPLVEGQKKLAQELRGLENCKTCRAKADNLILRNRSAAGSEALNKLLHNVEFDYSFTKTRVGKRPQAPKGK